MKHLFTFEPSTLECPSCTEHALQRVCLANNPYVRIAFFCVVCGYLDACMDCGAPFGATHAVECDLLETLEPGSPSREQWYSYLRKVGLIADSH